MILKALYDYYHRLKAIDSSLAPNGFKEQEIPFLIVIDKEGNFLDIEDRRTGKRTFYVIAQSRSGSLPKPYIMYDNLEYVLGWAKEVLPKTSKNHKAFIEKCNVLSVKYPDCSIFQAIVLFYVNDEIDRIKEHPLWNELTKKANVNISFLLKGETEIAAEKQCLSNEIMQEDEDFQRCLVTGKSSPCVKITMPVQIAGGQMSGARIISFQKGSGYDSYGKQQCENSPISLEAESSVSAALKRLLDRNSRNKFLIGNRTFLFWASSNSESCQKAEESMFSLFGFSDSEEDDPNRRIELVRSTFMSIYNGKLPSASDDKFYILGLAPNAARIAVVYWNETTVHDFAGMILKHFDDMEIVDGRKEKRPYYGLRQMMSAVTLGGKASDVQPNLPEATMKSILQGLPYPYTLFSSTIRRIRAEQADAMQIARLAIIKAYLNRTNNNKKITTMLDKENNNLGYVCGRLFAVLEYSQKRANNITTIKERYMNSASATPAAVFATLLNLNVHHVEKLDNAGVRIYIENMKQEIVALLPADGFPSHLDLQDQGRFFVGYYHQMQDIYTKKDNRE